MKINPRFRAHRFDQGFTLLEVLVTLVISAIALLGVASLQAQALRMNKGGESRAQALALANEMAERIEANNAGAVAQAYLSPLSQSTNTLASINSATTCLNQAGCNPTSLAAYDVGIWRNQLATNAILPNGQGVLGVVPVGSLYTYTITVCWQERAEKN
ncbi:MAG: type pilus modification protein PilV, partial [Pseudomonadota bacterium]